LHRVDEDDETILEVVLERRLVVGDGGTAAKRRSTVGVSPLSFLAWRGRRKGKEEIRRSRWGFAWRSGLRVQR
jgi:hypothetical protein